ncbi:MAG: cysteine hydrolase [Spirochaetes bacterium]|nr:cysteine hydrolase [Spirochaetota bacterium]
MSLVKKILIGAVVVILAAAALVVGSFMHLGTPTKGEPIGAYEKPNKALLVIDIQEDFSGPHSKTYAAGDAEAAIAAVNSVIDRAERAQWTIVYIRHEFSGFMACLSRIFMGGKATQASPGIVMDKRVAVRTKNEFIKHRGDSFSNPGLDAFLRKNSVNELVIVGLDAEYCVHNTARGALNRGYKVNIVRDAILLSNKEKWNELMDKYKRDGITILESKDL